MKIIEYQGELVQVEIESNRPPGGWDTFIIGEIGSNSRPPGGWDTLIIGEGKTLGSKEVS